MIDALAKAAKLLAEPARAAMPPAAEAMNTIGFVPEWQVGPDVNQTVRSVLSMRPEVRSFLIDYIKAANK